MGNSLILAALAVNAVPSISFRDVKNLTSDQGGAIDAALLTSVDGNHYVVRQAATDAAALELVAEVSAVQVLSGLGLPFKIAKPLGSTKAPGAHDAIVFEYVYGKSLNLSGINATHPLATSIGNAIAAIHNVSTEVVGGAGFPEFSASDTARTRLNELDRLAGTGKIPKLLLDRWSEALENVNMFRFNSTVVHSNLNAVNILELDQEVSGVLGWHGLKIGDPAEDFAWLATHADQELMDAVRFAYLGTRNTIDPNLAQRAYLYSEMTAGKWLLHGLTVGDETIVAEGSGMLALIAEEVENGIAPALTAGTFAKSGSGAFLESVEDQEPEVIVFNDDATREIELPERKDDELF